MDGVSSSATLGDALAAHLSASGLPPDQGDSERFAVVKVALMPYPIPNTQARKRAVKIHDLNHLVSGFKTDRIGELEISAWELASGGCGGYTAAWVLDLAGLVGGLFVAPGRTVRAFGLGRRSQNLYRMSLDTLLAMPLSEADAFVARPQRRRLRALPAALHLGLMVLAAIPASLAMMVGWYVVTPAWLLSRWKQRRRHAAPSSLAA